MKAQKYFRLNVALGKRFVIFSFGIVSGRHSCSIHIIFYTSHSGPFFLKALSAFVGKGIHEYSNASHLFGMSFANFFFSYPHVRVQGTSYIMWRLLPFLLKPEGKPWILFGPYGKLLFNFQGIMQYFWWSI